MKEKDSETADKPGSPSVSQYHLVVAMQGEQGHKKERKKSKRQRHMQKKNVPIS